MEDRRKSKDHVQKWTESDSRLYFWHELRAAKLQSHFEYQLAGLTIQFPGISPEKLCITIMYFVGYLAYSKCLINYNDFC